MFAVNVRVGTWTSLLLATLGVACGDSSSDSRGSATAGVTVSAGSITATGGLTVTATATVTDSGSGSGDASATGTTGGGSASASASGSTSSQPTGGGSGPKFDLGTLPDAGCQAGGDVDSSYIWIPGTGDGTVNKINTRTLVQEATYLIGPEGGTESASRTAVLGDGRFVVVNSRGTGRSTAVAASLADCKDVNGDGMITTSTSQGDIKPWGSDECVVWTLTHGNWSGSYTHGPRGITWTLGTWNAPTCSFVNPKVWLGYGTNAGADFVRLDGATGNVEEIIAVPGWDGSGYAPYGGALDPQQRPWFTGLRGELARVNTDQNPITVTRIPQPPEIQTYGMTVDPDGNPWMAGCSGPVSVYDINLQTWVSVAGTSACYRGMAIDHDFHAWVASNGPCELVEVDGKARTLVAKHQLPQCSTAIGVSVDVDGFVWLVDQAGWAWKIDPKNVPAMQMVSVPGDHYVYSDMTGGQLKSVFVPG